MPGNTSSLRAVLLATSLRQAFAYAAAAALTAMVVWLRWQLGPYFDGQAPLLLLLLAPIFAAAWLGLGPGLFATALAAVSGVALFIAPQDSLVPPNVSEWLRLGTFVTEGAIFSWLFEVRRRALSESERREERFHDALEAAPSGMILAERSGRIAFANARAREWFGYRASEFAKLAIEALVPVAARERHREERAAFAAAPAARSMGSGRDLHAVRKDGSEFPVEIGLSPVESGGQSLVLAAIVDITERVRAVAQLVESERRQRFLLALTEQLQALDDPAAMMDAATRSLGEHLAVAQVGYGEIDAAQQHVIVERDWNDGQIPSVVGTWRMDDFGPAFIRDMKAGQTIVIPDVMHDPRTNSRAVLAAYASIHTRAILDTPLIRDGRMVSMIFVHHPQPRAWSATDALLVEETCARVWTAVERVRADGRARVLLSLLDRAGAAARVGAFVDRLQGPQPLTWSGRMFDILGVPPGAQPIREAAFDPFPHAVRSILRAALEEIQRTGTPFEIELPLLPKPGAAEWVRLYVVPTMRDGRCIELSGAMQDISDRKRLELEVVEATNQERARIGADLHDDLGQVLTAVTLQVGAFKRSLDSTPPEEQRRHVQQVESNLEHARTVCRRLARTYVAPVTSVSFLAMLRQLARDVPGDRQCQVRGAELPPATPPVVAQELYRIAQEALTNALKHSQCQRVDFDVRVDPDRLTLVVQDDGVGMPRDPATPGVGLASMRSRAARIGGVVTLAPAADRGTRVTVVCARQDVVAA